MKPRQVLGKYFEVYGQARPITPEAGEKKAPFLEVIFLKRDFKSRIFKILTLKFLFHQK